MRRLYRLPALAASAVLVAGSTTAVALAATRTDAPAAVPHVEDVQHAAEPRDDNAGAVATPTRPADVRPAARPRAHTQVRPAAPAHRQAAAVEPGDDNGGAVEPGDDNGGAVEPGDDSGASHGSDDSSSSDSGHGSGGGSDDGGSHG